MCLDYKEGDFIFLKFKDKLNSFHLWFINFIHKSKINELYGELMSIYEAKTQLYQLRSTLHLLQHLPTYIKAFKRLFKHYTKEYNRYEDEIKLTRKQRRAFAYLVDQNKSFSFKTVGDLHYWYYQQSINKRLPHRVPIYNELTIEDHRILIAKLVEYFNQAR